MAGFIDKRIKIAQNSRYSRLLCEMFEILKGVGDVITHSLQNFGDLQYFR